MLFDTHCHLNFKVFDNMVEEVVGAARNNGVNHMVVVGTDERTSFKAVEIAEKYKGIYAAIGVHPHHAYKLNQKIDSVGEFIPTFAKASVGKPASAACPSKSLLDMTKWDRDPFLLDTYFLEKLITSKKVVAIGEVGIDKHEYQKTKYTDYKVDENFVEGQKKLFNEQIKIALQYNKSLIIHNRRAREDVLEILTEVWEIGRAHV